MSDTMQVSSELYGITPPLPRKVDTILLGGAGAESYTVPAGTRWVIINANGGVWYRVGAVANAPVGDVTDGTGSAYLGAGQAKQARVEEGVAISFIRDGAAAVNVVIERFSN